MIRWPLFIISRLGTIAVIGYIAWTAWAHLGPSKPEVGPVRQELAKAVMPAIINDLKTSREDIRRVALLHFDNDPTDHFTQALRGTLERSGIIDLRDRTVQDKARDLLNLRHPAYAEMDAALARGRTLKVQGVLFGKVHNFESLPGGSKINVEVTLAEVATGREVFSRTYVHTGPISVSAAQFQEASRSFPWLQRLLGWSLFILLLPVFSFTFIRTMMRKGANRTNALVLAAYTLPGALLGWLLFSAVLTHWLPVLAFIAAIGLAMLYNVWIMSFAVRLEET